MEELNEQEKEFLLTALYEGARSIQPTMENKIIIEGVTTKLGLSEEDKDYVSCDLGADDLSEWDDEEE